MGSYTHHSVTNLYGDIVGSCDVRRVTREVDTGRGADDERRVLAQAAIVIRGAGAVIGVRDTRVCAGYDNIERQKSRHVKQELGHTWVLTSLEDGGGSGGEKTGEDNECERGTHYNLQGVMEI